MNREYYAEKGLILGIGSILMAFYFNSSVLFTPKSSLVEITGEIDKIKVAYNEVTSSRGGKSIKSELKFTLVGKEKVFGLMKNIGQKKHNHQFEEIKEKLDLSGKSSVLVKKNEMEDFKPHVFRIEDGNGNVLYDIPDAKSHSKAGFLVAMGLGIVGIGVYFRYKYLARKRN